MELINVDGLLPIKYQSNNSNFYISFDTFKKEYIEYHPLNNSNTIKYHCELGTTLLDILNNFESIINLLNRYQDKFKENKINDFDNIVLTLDTLKSDILEINSHLHILNMYVDMLIFEIIEKEKNRVLEKYNLCENCIIHLANLKEELYEASNFALSCFFRTYNFSQDTSFDITELKNNTNFYTSAFRTLVCNNLCLPNVKLTYINIEDNKAELSSFQYSIFSLENFLHVTLYQLQQNEKAILQCSNCSKFFIPKEHKYIYDSDTKANDHKIIKERNIRITCSEKCAIERKNNQTKINNSTDYRKEIKSLRTELQRTDKKYLTNLKQEFENKYASLKNKLESEFCDKEIIDEKLLKFVLTEKENLKNIKNNLKQQK